MSQMWHGRGWSRKLLCVRRCSGYEPGFADKPATRPLSAFASRWCSQHREVSCLGFAFGVGGLSLPVPLRGGGGLRSEVSWVVLVLVSFSKCGRANTACSDGAPPGRIAELRASSGPCQ